MTINYAQSITILLEKKALHYCYKCMVGELSPLHSLTFEIFLRCAHYYQSNTKLNAEMSTVPVQWCESAEVPVPLALQ